MNEDKSIHTYARVCVKSETTFYSIAILLFIIYTLKIIIARLANFTTGIKIKSLPCPCHEGVCGIRHVVPLVLTPALDGGEWLI